MTTRGVIYAEKHHQCDECGEVEELRPYGPGGIKVCHPCLTSHPEWEEEAKARMAHLVWGEPLPVEYAS